MADRNVKVNFLGVDVSLSRTMKGAAGEAGKLGDATERTGRAGKAATTAMIAGGAAVVAFAKRSADAYLAQGKEVAKLARLTGDSVQNASKLRVVAQQSGVEFNTLARSATLFSKALNTEKGSAQLRALGVAATDATGRQRPFLDIITDIAGALEDMPNGLEKNRILMTLFGKSGAELGPLMSKGAGGIKEISDKAERLGLVMSDTEGIKKQVQAQRDYELAMQGLQATLGRDVLPLVTKLATTGAEGFSALASAASHVPEPIRSIGTGAIAALGSLSLLGGIWGKVKAGLANVPGLDRLRTKLVTVGDDGQRSFTRLGTAAKIAGGVIAGAAITDAVFGIINSVQDLDAKATASMNHFVANMSGGARTVVTNFSDQLAQLESDTLKWSHLTTVITDNSFKLGGVGREQNVSDLHAAFNKLLNTEGPAAAQRLIDSVREMDRALDKNSDDYRSSEDIIRNHWQPAVDDAEGAAKEHAKAVDADSKSVDENTLSAKENAKSWKELADRQRAAIDPLFGYVASVTSATDAQQKANDAVKEFGPRSKEAAAAAMEAAQANAEQDSALLQLRADIDAGNVSMTEAKARLDSWVASGRMTKAQADLVALSFGAAASQAKAIPNRVNTTVTADITQFANVIASAGNMLDSFLRKQAAGVAKGIIGVMTKSASAGSAASAPASQRTPPPLPVGKRSGYRDVGRDGHTYTWNGNAWVYEDGGVWTGSMLPRTSSIEPGRGHGLVQWAEATTGGEAHIFIPLGDSKAAKAQPVLVEAAARMGAFQPGSPLGQELAARVQPARAFADGGLLEGPGGARFPWLWRDHPWMARLAEGLARNHPSGTPSPSEAVATPVATPVAPNVTFERGAIVVEVGQRDGRQVADEIARHLSDALARAMRDPGTRLAVGDQVVAGLKAVERHRGTSYRSTTGPS